MWEYRAAAKEDNFHSRAQKKFSLQEVQITRILRDLKIVSINDLVYALFMAIRLLFYST